MFLKLCGTYLTKALYHQIVVMSIGVTRLSEIILIHGILKDHLYLFIGKGISDFGWWEIIQQSLYCLLKVAFKFFELTLAKETINEAFLA